MRELVGSKNTIGRTTAVLKKPHKATFTFTFTFLHISFDLDKNATEDVHQSVLTDYEFREDRVIGSHTLLRGIISFIIRTSNTSYSIWVKISVRDPQKHNAAEHWHFRKNLRSFKAIFLLWE